MVLVSLQVQKPINLFNHINSNKLVQTEAVNYVLIPFEGNINPEDPTGIRLYLQATKEIDK